MGERGTKQYKKYACDRSGDFVFSALGCVPAVHVGTAYNSEVKCLKLSEVSTEFWVNKDTDGYSMEISGAMNEMSLERVEMKWTFSK